MKRYLFWALALALALVGCGKKTTEEEMSVELQGIGLSKKSLSMEVGDKKTLIVVYNPEDAAKFAPAVTWESSSERVATVQDGKVTAKQKGKTTITAYCGRFSADCEVEVENATVPVTPKLEVSPTTIDDKGQGGTYTVTVTCNRSWTADCEQPWATVSPAEGNGDATVTVTVEANMATSADAQTITFTAGTVKKTVTVNRPAYHKICPITLDIKEKEVGVEGGSFDVQVTSEADWNVKCDNARVHITKTGNGASVTVDINKKELVRKKSVDSISVVFYNDDVTDTLLIKQELPYAGMSPYDFISAYGLNYTCKLESNISWSIVFEYDTYYSAQNYMQANPSSGTGDATVNVKIKKVHTDGQEKTGGGSVWIKGTGEWEGIKIWSGNTDYHWANF